MANITYVSSWECRVQDCISSVRRGQHLRFIGSLFRTFDVCVAALEHETSHNFHPYDIHVVPAGIIEAVVEKIKEIRKDHGAKESLFPYLDQVVANKKEDENKPGYYDFDNLQLQMEHYKAKTFDDMLKAMYEQS